MRGRERGREREKGGETKRERGREREREKEREKERERTEAAAILKLSTSFEKLYICQALHRYFIVSIYCWLTDFVPNPRVPDSTPSQISKKNDCRYKDVGRLVKAPVY